MDIRILKSLATCALFPYLPEGADKDGPVHDGGEYANGAQFPDEVAREILGVTDRTTGSIAFSAAFNLAFKLALLILADPLRSPDLERAIAEGREFARPDSVAEAA